MAVNNTGIMTEIAALEDLRWQLRMARETDALEPLLHDDVVYIHSTGHVDDKASFLSGCREGLIEYHSVDYAITNQIVHGDTVIVSARMNASLTAAGALRDVNNEMTSVWLKTESPSGPHWQLAVCQATRAL
jgi:hypothetical protein